MSLSLDGQIYDPDDPMGKLFINILATFAEFEVDLIRMRTREGWPWPGQVEWRQPNEPYRSDAEDGTKTVVDVADQDVGQPAGLVSEE